MHRILRPLPPPFMCIPPGYEPELAFDARVPYPTPALASPERQMTSSHGQQDEQAQVWENWSFLYCSHSRKTNPNNVATWTHPCGHLS